MSDFHKLTTTILRKTISKGNAKKIFRRNYKAFDHNTFELKIKKSKLKSETIIDYSQLQSIFLETLNNIAPVKMKILRYNNNPFMKKALRKAIMTRSRLKNKFNRNSSAKNCNSYKQRNFCLKLLRQTKEKYFNKINVKKVSDNKTFWKSLKRFFSNKGLNSSNILLVEGNEIVNDDGKIATIMNRYFANITKHMNLKANKISHREELVNTLDAFKNHKSVPWIKLVNFHCYCTLNFSKVTESEVKKEILNL